MANLGNQKIKDTYTLVLQTDAGGNLQNLDGTTPNPFIINQNLRNLDGTTHPSGYVLTSDGSGNASWNSVAFSGDVYISGGSIEGTTIQLQASSGGTVSVPGLSWSSSTSGHISNSGLTGNVGVGTSTPNKPLTVVGDISGTTDLYLGDSTNTASTITAEETLTIKGTVGNDFLYLANDRIQMYMDGGQIADMTPTSISFNASSNNVDFNVKSDDGTALIRTRAEHNIVRLLDHVSINKPTGWVQVDEQQQALAVSGTSVFYSGGSSNNAEAIVAIGNISGTTDLYLGDLAHTASTIVAQEQLTIKGRGVDNDFMTLKEDTISFSLDGAQSIKFTSPTEGGGTTGSYSFNASGLDYDFKITGEDNRPIFNLDGGDSRIRIQDHVTIGPNASISHADAVKWGLAVTGSSLFISGGTSLANTNAIEASGGISGTTDLYIGQNTFIGGVSHVSGNTFFEGTLSGTGNVTTMGNVTAVGSMKASTNLFVGDNIKHVSDETNEISFAESTQDFRTNNTSRIDIDESGVRLGGANSRVTTILTEDNMGSNSATALATQQSIKAYVDGQSGHDETLQEVTDNGTTTTNAIQLGSNLGISGDTFYEGALSGTGDITTTTNVGATNLTASNNLYVSGDTFYEGALSGTGNITTVGNLILGDGTNYFGGKRLVTSDSSYEFRDGSVTATNGLISSNLTASNNLYVTGDTFYEGVLSGTGSISTIGNLNVGRKIYSGNVDILAGSTFKYADLDDGFYGMPGNAGWSNTSWGNFKTNGASGLGGASQQIGITLPYKAVLVGVKGVFRSSETGNHRFALWTAVLADNVATGTWSETITTANINVLTITRPFNFSIVDGSTEFAAGTQIIPSFFNDTGADNADIFGNYMIIIRRVE